MTRHRFFIPPEWIDHRKVTLIESVAHRIRNVLRMQAGDRVIVLDDSGWEREIELTHLAKNVVMGRVLLERLAPAEPRTKISLYQAVLNASRSHLRSSFRRRRRERRAALERARSTDWDSAGPDLSSALDALSPRQRAVVHLTYWEELTGPEVAQRLGISEGSVRTHLARAKNVLRGLIDG